MKQKIKEYKELVNNLYDQFYTNENLEKMKRTIANKDDYRKEYSRGGEMMHRGYYCPSLIFEIIVTNCKRGKLLKRTTSKRPNYCYYFNGAHLVLVQKYHEDIDTDGFEWIERDGDIEYSILFESDTFEDQPYITVTEYDNANRVIKNIHQSYYFDKNSFSLEIEEYIYGKSDLLVGAKMKMVDIFDKHLYEDKYDLSFKYDDEGQLIGCLFHGDDEYREIPTNVKNLIMKHKPVTESMLTGTIKKIEKEQKGEA